MMDKYTSETKTWLEQGFGQFQNTGIYQAHQPIYGFRAGNSESGVMDKYAITYQTMKVLTHIRFTTLLDVGAGEGYKAHVIKKLFQSDVTASDLSEEACKRTYELFDIRSVQADIHSLPFDDNQFDIVLCSETLEHVSHWKRAVHELLRVSRSAVVITVPHERAKSRNNFTDKSEHEHINFL
ncbi:MAG: class I SAM-dependent methyltransferase [Patescibacteria group bacterium]